MDNKEIILPIFTILFIIIISLVVYKLISRELTNNSGIQKKIINECKTEVERNIALSNLRRRNKRKLIIITLVFYIGLPIICFPCLLVIRKISVSKMTTIVASQDYVKKYSYAEPWYSSGTDGGYSIYEIKIKSTSKNENPKTDEIQAELFHTMTPFSQTISTDITLKLTEDNKYAFSFTDAWNNKAFGWVKFDSEEIELYLDCNEFYESGKTFARLYGETITLHETTNDKDFLKRTLGEK